jgi:hypothetical protein
MQNPWIIFQGTWRERLQTLAADTSFRQRLAAILAERQEYSGTDRHGHLFSAIVSGDRPASDYTPRIIPASSGAAIPLELH